MTVFCQTLIYSLYPKTKITHKLLHIVIKVTYNFKQKYNI